MSPRLDARPYGTRVPTARTYDPGLFDDLRDRNRRRAILGAVVLWPAAVVVTVPLALAVGLETFVAVGLAVEVPLSEVSGRGEGLANDAFGVTFYVVLAMAIVGPPLVAAVADRAIPASLRARRAERGEGSDVTEGLALAAGIAAPHVLVVRSASVNASCLGRRGGASVVLVTEGALRLPRSELEALCSLAVADLATGGATVRRIRLASAAGLLIPGLLLEALARVASARPRVAAAIAGAAALAGGLGFQLSDDDPTTGGFVVAVIAFLVVMSMLSVMLGGLVVLGLGVIFLLGLPMVRPTRAAADVGAVELTRQADGLVALFERSVRVPTRVGFGPCSLGALWVLPPGRAGASRRTQQRRLDSLSEAGLLMGPRPVLGSGQLVGSQSVPPYPSPDPGT